mgnify:FL=1|jgi:hypothetical protein
MIEKDPIEEKYHRQAEELKKELEEEGKAGEIFGYIFFTVLILGIVVWFLVGPTKIKIAIVATAAVLLLFFNYIILPKITALLDLIGDFFEKLLKK